jgi:hypothetical protein
MKLIIDILRPITVSTIVKNPTIYTNQINSDDFSILVMSLILWVLD